MSAIVLKHIKKIYPGTTEAVIHNVNISIEQGEFIVFVGPSGSGKSTLLRIIAGLEHITKGDLYFADNRVNDIEPGNRNIAMVFQNYALYPHMSVYKNISYGLKNKGEHKDVIERKVQNAAKILEITHLLHRKPHQLSGGQRQRVAMGRAIVRDPYVFLFDEPLSNLDAKLRAQMRVEIKKLHQNLQVTTVYVTHDQMEAMTMADRMAVLNHGEIQQFDTPINVYNNPSNAFVAGFLGTPPMNLIPLNYKDGAYHAHNGDTFPSIPHAQDTPNILYGFRPEHCTFCSEKQSMYSIEASFIEVLGNDTLLYGTLGGKEIMVTKTGIQDVTVGTVVHFQVKKQYEYLFENNAPYSRLLL